MPRFEPFRALRYATAQPDDLAALIAPPYDVLSEDEVRELHARSPHNVSHVDDPRGGEDRYRRAGELFSQWRDDGVLVADDSPSLTVYRLRFTDSSGRARDVAGVLGGLEVVDEGAGGVLPHERVTPKASTDRLDLTRATAANLSPIWGLSLAPGLTELLREPGEVLGRVVDGVAEQAVEHVVERIADPSRIAAIGDLVGGHDVLIADGHHRYGISRTYRDEQPARGAGSNGSAGSLGSAGSQGSEGSQGSVGSQGSERSEGSEESSVDGGADLTLTFVSELAADQLSVEAIHRLYTGVDFSALRGLLAERFDLTPLHEVGTDTLAAMDVDGFLVLVGPTGAERLDPKPGAFDRVRSLDGAWLEDTLAPLLESDQAEVTYQHGLDETLAAVRQGRAVAGVLIRPVGVAEIERTAREGLLMPPKSTFFTPKLKTGFVIRAMTSRGA